MMPPDFLKEAATNLKKHGLLLSIPDHIPDEIYGEAPLSEVEKLGCKLATTVLLQSGGNDRKLVLVSRSEWIGLNLLELDGELPNGKVSTSTALHG